MTSKGRDGPIYPIIKNRYRFGSSPKCEFRITNPEVIRQVEEEGNGTDGIYALLEIDEMGFTWVKCLSGSLSIWAGTESIATLEPGGVYNLQHNETFLLFERFRLRWESLRIPASISSSRPKKQPVSQNQPQQPQQPPMGIASTQPSSPAISRAAATTVQKPLTKAVEVSTQPQTKKKTSRKQSEVRPPDGFVPPAIEVDDEDNKENLREVVRPSVKEVKESEVKIRSIAADSTVSRYPKTTKRTSVLIQKLESSYDEEDEDEDRGISVARQTPSLSSEDDVSELEAVSSQGITHEDEEESAGIEMVPEFRVPEAETEKSFIDPRRLINLDLEEDIRVEEIVDDDEEPATQKASQAGRKTPSRPVKSKSSTAKTPAKKAAPQRPVARKRESEVIPITPSRRAAAVAPAPAATPTRSRNPDGMSYKEASRLAALIDTPARSRKSTVY